MSGSELERQQIRRAIRQMGNEYVFYLLDDAISLLSQAQLRQLIAPYANPDQFIEHEAPQKDLLAKVLAFQKTSLAGEYYEETPIAARNCEENPRGTLCWIADFRRLLGRCAAESSSASAADVCRTFEILFGLLDNPFGCSVDRDSSLSQPHEMRFGCATHARLAKRTNQLAPVNAASIIGFLVWKNAISSGGHSAPCPC